ncbi:ubiquinol-cytochrome C reductase [Colletotrichum scovillei]|uniref:Complex III subunit 9 n=1 Tax=Colletotrichum scovillei TaxID=1209932 RepID=A0A9P7R8C8_9PEZI|nr:ubiquinol-cytochrome C reductase [Colletotrichum scovillei]KAG7069828.1 ubiquinol-cytochrome C reductase [Colletotrichum scovillei]
MVKGKVDHRANQSPCISAKLSASRNIANFVKTPNTIRFNPLFPPNDSSPRRPQRSTTCHYTRRANLTDDNSQCAIFKNNFSMLGFVFATGFAFEMGFNGAMNKYWDYLNRGRQWKDIRHKYVEAADDDEE